MFVYSLFSQTLSLFITMKQVTWLLSFAVVLAIVQADYSLKLEGIDPAAIHNISGRMYYVSPDGTSDMIETAYRFCNDIGMTLISLETAEEKVAVYDELVKNDMDDVYFWTSSKHLVNDLFLWSGTGQLLTFEDWAYQNPYGNPANSPCMTLNTLLGWHNIPCHQYRRFICEQP